MEKIKLILSKIWSWIKGLEVEGVLGLVLGIWLLFQGWKLWAGIAIGVYATKQWDLIKTWIKEKMKI